MAATCIFCKIIKGKLKASAPHVADQRGAWRGLKEKVPGHPTNTANHQTGEIPCFKLFESDKTLAFLDINPLSKGHALVIPKFHGAKLTDIPDEHLSEILPLAKKLAAATNATNFNVLQNNGRIAHQEVDHVHFHMIPKPNEEQGLVVGWPQQKTDMGALKALFEELKPKV
ncbi:Adenosine 5'-monophosphoramidase [Parahypoxylon ruwenzoriense]